MCCSVLSHTSRLLPCVACTLQKGSATKMHSSSTPCPPTPGGKAASSGPIVHISLEGIAESYSSRIGWNDKLSKGLSKYRGYRSLGLGRKPAAERIESISLLLRMISLSSVVEARNLWIGVVTLDTKLRPKRAASRRPQSASSPSSQPTTEGKQLCSSAALQLE